MADNSPKTNAPVSKEPERRVSVKLLSDVWIDEPGHPDADAGGIRRIKTNVPVLDEETGAPMVDRKTRTAIVTQTIAEIPVSIAKRMIEEGKAVRQDPL